MTQNKPTGQTDGDLHILYKINTFKKECVIKAL